jgi:hypothetical protein
MYADELWEAIALTLGPLLQLPFVSHYLAVIARTVSFSAKPIQLIIDSSGLRSISADDLFRRSRWFALLYLQVALQARNRESELHRVFNRRQLGGFLRVAPECVDQ